MCLRIIIIALLVVLIGQHMTIPEHYLMGILIITGAGVSIDLICRW